MHPTDPALALLPGILLVSEWGGALFAIAGALVISMNRPWSRFAWPLWILSNLLLTVPTAYGEHWGLVAMQAAFFVVNVNGLLRCHRTPERLSTSGVCGDGQ